jgi:hypothetical protein
MSDETGFLTDVDKEFLRGEKEYDSKQGRYGRRQAIRERTREAFHDFALLYDELTPRERDRVFDPDKSDAAKLTEAMRDTIAFLYRSLEGDRDRPISQERTLTANFNEIFEPGIKRGERDRQPSDERGWARLLSDYGYVEYEPFRVEFKQNPPVPDPGAVIKRLVDEGPYALSDGELRALIHHATLETCSPEPASPRPEGSERFDLHTFADSVSEYAESRGVDLDADEWPMLLQRNTDGEGDASDDDADAE